MKTSIFLATAVALLSSSAFGQSLIVQTKTFSGIPDFSQPLLFNQYDGNLSDLTSVNVSYTIRIEGGQFIVDNDSNVPATTTAEFGASLDATSSDVALIDSSFQPIIQGIMVTNSQTFNLGPDNGDGVNNYDSAEPDGGILIGQAKTGSGGGNVSQAVWSDYVGSGTFTINAIADQVGKLSYNSGIETATTPVSASGTITVTYCVVPEPSTAALAGIAVLGLALRRRRA